MSDVAGAEQAAARAWKAAIHEPVRKYEWLPDDDVISIIVAAVWPVIAAQVRAETVRAACNAICELTSYERFVSQDQALAAVRKLAGS